MHFDLVCKVTGDIENGGEYTSVLLGLGRNESIEVPAFILHLGNDPVLVNEVGGINIAVAIKDKNRLDLISGKITIADFVTQNVREHYINNEFYSKKNPEQAGVLKSILGEGEFLNELILPEFTTMVIDTLLNKSIAVRHSENPSHGYKSVL